MMIELIRNLYQYNAWTNSHILDIGAQLNPDQLRVEASASFGSVHGTLSTS